MSNIRHPMSRRAGLTFAVLGEVRCWRDGVEVPLGTPRQRALLAVLLLREGTPMGRDDILGGLWGDSFHVDGANLVQVYVSKMRRLLEPDRPPRAAGSLLPRVGTAYRLAVEADQWDLGCFQQARTEARELWAAGRAGDAERVLAEAFTLWPGPALAGVEGPLLDGERVRLAELRLAATEEHLELALETGAEDDVIPALLTLTREHPYRERLWALLMVALYRSSRQADALAAYRRAARSLKEDLGLSPGAELRRVEEAILAGVPSATLAARPRTGSVRPRHRPGPAPGRPRLTLVQGTGGDAAPSRGAAVPPYRVRQFGDRR
ncbi:AfsR/SARP family transcriptional regulator [Streptomyces sp. AS02]|uniref:AfsR/SARP family transcriptional regulator n=1 Tax=Streptomyces sp. AS02 TaxID=2938946 RepID=UPI0020216175|nr:AfsR/SARP family transcriptional regulator [Streptomyces sp. AS02]MCL8017542.1 AfsR/SARP family transcriptional regulator [Streptomyces sp. AS02]